MSYLLAGGVSFCRAGERLIFLDLAADRYVALPAAAAESFERLVSGVRLSCADCAELGRLERQGLLVAATAGSRPAPCPAPPRPAASLLDEPGAGGFIETAAALARIALVRLELRRRPLGKVIARLEHRKAACAGSGSDPQALRRTGFAFREAALFASPLDQCLPRAIATAHALLGQGCSPTLVIGVSARPFAAHCWVQCGGVLVTERLDEVRNFTPILVI